MLARLVAVVLTTTLASTVAHAHRIACFPKDALLDAYRSSLQEVPVAGGSVGDGQRVVLTRGPDGRTWSVTLITSGGGPEGEDVACSVLRGTGWGEPEEGKDEQEPAEGEVL